MKKIKFELILNKVFKIVKQLLIFFAVFIWIFGGWPQIWQKPPIPPKIQQAYGATNVKVGTFTKITTTGNQSITGLGFQPKAIIFFWSRNTANATGQAPRSQGIGFTDCTNQRVVTIAENDNAVTSNAGRYRSESNVIVILSNGNPTVESRASFVSCNTDGFTINWAVSGNTAHIINYIALGGSDITNVTAGTFTLTNSTGNQSVTGLGFKPDFLMFLWSFTEAVDTASAGLEMGFGFADAFGNQGSIVNVVRDNEGNNSTKYSQQRTDQVILLTNVNGAQDALANFVSMDNDGFTVNKSDAPANNTPIFYLAIRGGSHKVGNFLQPTTTGVQSIGGVGFQPQGLVLFSRNRAIGTTLTAPATISFGAGGQATTSRAVVWGQSRNIDPSQTAVYTDNTKIMLMRTITGTGGAGTINAQADLYSFNADGFSLNWTSADIIQRQIIYWAIGNSPTFNQSAYRFFDNQDSTNVGTPLANQDTPATLTSSGQAFRLRVLIHNGNGILKQNEQFFKLQFAERGSDNLCDTSFSGENYNDITTGGELDTSFNQGGSGANSTVFTIILLSDGKILIGGAFTSYNGTTTNRIARLNSDGTLDTSFNQGGSGANDAIYTIAPLSDGKILIGGAFTSYNGTTTNRIARLNSDGTLDTSFNQGGGGANNTIRTIAPLSDGKILIGGAFTSYNGTTTNRIARLNSDGTLDTSFNQGGSGANSTVFTIVPLSDGKILIGGLFTSYNGTSISGIARLNSDGTLDTSFNQGGSGANLSIRTIVPLSDGKILIGGDFTSYNGTSISGIARLNSDGTLDTSFNPGGTGTDRNVLIIKNQTDGKILIGGLFSYYNNLPAQRIARLMGPSIITYNDNPTPTDGSPLTANTNDPIHGTDTIRNQTYEEANPFTNSVSAINAGEDGKWDFSLKDNGAPPGTSYCFRVVKADGTLLDNYNVIPEITIQSSIISIYIFDGEINYGIIPASSSKSTCDLNDTQIITNNGNRTINLNIKGTTTTCWSLGNSPGNEVYVHKFTTSSCPINWNNAPSLTTDYQSLFTGLSPNATTTLNLQVTTPTSTTCFSSQSVNVTIQAIEP